jgi:lambda family phage portal protein
VASLRQRFQSFRRAGLGRLRAVAAAIVLGAYKAAETGRLMSDFRARTTSADAAMLPALAVLQPRLRDLIRNDAFAKSAVRAFRRNVVGRGIWPSPAKLLEGGKPGELDQDWNARVEQAWEEWADDAAAVDRERKRTFAAVQRWVITELVTMGEAIVVLNEVAGPDGMLHLQLQLFEAEQLDGVVLKHDLGNGTFNEVRGGVEVDEFGAPVAYHLRPATLPDVVHRAPTSNRIPADRVLHIFEPDRPRQTRGESRFVSVVTALWHLSQYEQAQQVAARAEACIGLTIASDEPEETDEETNEDGEKKSPKDPIEVTPFTIFRHRTDEEVKPFLPQRPGNLYEPFVKMQIRRIAAGCGLSYEMVARDWTGGSYSSLRQGMLEDRREFRELQELIVSRLCQPVYVAKMRVDLIAGRLKGPSTQRGLAALARTQWMPEGWDWIDPENEAQAFSVGLDKNLITLDEIHSSRGRNWRDVVTQRGIERQAEIAAGAEPVRDQAPPQAKPAKADAKTKTSQETA